MTPELIAKYRALRDDLDALCEKHGAVFETYNLGNEVGVRVDGAPGITILAVNDCDIDYAADIIRTNHGRSRCGKLIEKTRTKGSGCYTHTEIDL